MATNSRSPLYLILALIVCALLILPYIIPQSGEQIRREEAVNYVPSNKKLKPTFEAKPSDTAARELSSIRKEENKRKLEEIEKLLD